MATYKYTNTSADIGQVNAPDIKIPKREAEDAISLAEKRAASINANPMQLLAGLGRPSTLQTAAASGLAGLQAGMAMPNVSPELAALTGALTGIQSYGGLQQQARQQQLSELDLIPVDDISPNLVEQFPELSGVPIGMLNKMSGLFSAMGKQKVKPITAGTKAQLKSLRPDLTESMLDSIDEATASKYVLEFTKEQGRGERAQGEKLLATDPMLDEYSKTIGVPTSSLVGKDAKTINAWYGRIKTRQERVTYGEPKPILNNDGDVIGYFQTSSQGKIASNVMPLAAGASQKQKDLSAVSNIMVDLFNTVKGFEPESGPMQRFVGFKESIKARAGLAADKKAFIDSLDSFLGNLSREYSGERGVLTDQDVNRIKGAMPSLYDTEEEIDFKLKQVYKVIAERQKAISGGRAVVPGLTETKSGNDPLGIR